MQDGNMPLVDRQYMGEKNGEKMKTRRGGVLYVDFQALKQVNKAPRAIRPGQLRDTSELRELSEKMGRI
jgi:hypothetical protein